MQKISLIRIKEYFRKIIYGHFNYIKIAIMYLWCLIKKTDNELLTFENKHKGERCFIIGTAPSLTVDDINKLNNEITISVNSIVNLFSKTNWRPTYYVISDPLAYEKLKKKLKDIDIDRIFYNCFNIPRFCRNAIPLKCNSAFLTYRLTKVSKCRRKKIHFSNDAQKGFFEGQSVVYLAMQLAAYMGFSEIYLLGCDCDYSKRYYAKGADYSREFPDKEHDAYECMWMISDYLDAKPVLEKMGIKVFNCTRGGKLEVFERKDLDLIV